MKESTILIVEDDESIRQLYKDALTNAKFKVLTASNGEEGVAVALEQHPDLLLVDLMMPVMNGHEAIQAIRKDNWGKQAKVIFLTNLSDPKDVFHAVKLKPEEYIVKSHAEIKDIINKVRTAIHS